MNDTVKQSCFWYIPILIILTLGYVIGGCLVFGIHYLNWFPSLTDTTARLILKLFGMGMLGSTMYCTKYWAKDINEAILEPKFLPHAFDSFGYAATVIGGGITGTILYMAIKSGAILILTDSSNIETRLSFALFIAFLGGLFHFKVKDIFENAFERIFKKNRDETEQ
jgi:hypothetical protein